MLSMHRFYQATLSQLAKRWLVLVNELEPYGAGKCPDILCIDVIRFMHEVERLIIPDPFEQDILITVRNLVEQGDAKIAMFRLHEVISGRLPEGPSFGQGFPDLR
jgi:hypothetical protein